MAGANGIFRSTHCGPISHNQEINDLTLQLIIRQAGIQAKLGKNPCAYSNCTYLNTPVWYPCANFPKCQKVQCEIHNLEDNECIDCIIDNFQPQQ